jgi:hypothetical protein
LRGTIEGPPEIGLACHAAEGRPDFLRIDRKPRIRVGRVDAPEDWPPSDFER